MGAYLNGGGKVLVLLLWTSIQRRDSDKVRNNVLSEYKLSLIGRKSEELCLADNSYMGLSYL